MADKKKPAFVKVEVTAAGRLAELKKERDERIYEEAREAAGFDNWVDYENWLVLEELRTLTLSERAVAVEAATVAYAKPGLSVEDFRIRSRPKLQDDPF